MKFPGKIRKTAACFLLFCIVLACIPVHAEENEAVEISAPSGVLMEPETKTILYEKDKDTRRSPASVTKVMTLLLIFDHLKDGSLKLTDTVMTSAHAKSMGGSQVFLEEGETQDVETMIKCIVVASGNDASVAMAEHIAGSEEAFVKEMNARAEGLGMENTHFVDCCGLTDSDEHYTTAYDIALMSRELMLRHPDIRRYTTVWMDTLREGASSLVNTNKLVRFYDGTTGLKTGSTNAAGYCISATAERDGMELIAVILKGKTSPERFADAQTLLNYGFASYALKTVIPDEPLPPVPVTLGTQATVQPVLGEENQLLLEKAKTGELSQSVTLESSVQAPVAVGDRLGTLTVTFGEEVLVELPLLAGEEVPRITFRQMLPRVLRIACLVE